MGLPTERLTEMKMYWGPLSYLWILIAMPLAAATSRIYVNNFGGTTIDVIDPATNKIVQVIKGIEAPEASQFSPDGTRVYITYGAEKFLDVVDRKTGKQIKKVPLSGYANDMRVTKDGKRVLICIHEIPGSLDIIDTTSLEKVKSIPTKMGLHDIVLTADGKYAITDQVEGKTLTVFDLQNDKIAWEVPFERGVQPVAVESNPDGSGRRIFLQLRGLYAFVVVDFATHREVARIKMPDEPTGFASGVAPHCHGLAVAPDGKTLWVDSDPANSVFVYSLPDLQLLGHVSLPERELRGKPPMGALPNWITFTPDSRRVYVADRSQQAVSAIDAETMKVVAVIPVGESPDRISTLVLP
jgi:YVTN family beta-propeller protein